MFIVQNRDNSELMRTESFARAKDRALDLKKEFGENFDIIEIKQVWTTQTLEEAFEGSMYELVREQEGS